MEEGLLERSISKKNAIKLEDSKIIRARNDKFSIVSDSMFETMINNSSRKRFAAYLIALVLNEDYNEILESLVLMKEKLDKNKYDSSKKTVDFVCTIKGEIIGIEMNNNADRDTLIRNIIYATDLTQSEMKTGSSYNYRKVIQININNFTFEGYEELYDKVMFRTEKNILYTNNLKFYNIYLPILREKMYNKEKLSTLEKLILVYTESNKVAKRLAKGDGLMEDYIKEASEASSEDEIIGLYDKELHQERLMLGRIEKAELKGLEKGKQEIAKSMLIDNLDIKSISKYTGLSEEEIEKLK